MSRPFCRNNESPNSLNSGFHAEIKPSDEQHEILQIMTTRLAAVHKV